MDGNGEQFVLLVNVREALDGITDGAGQLPATQKLCSDLGVIEAQSFALSDNARYEVHPSDPLFDVCSQCRQCDVHEQNPNRVEQSGRECSVRNGAVGSAGCLRDGASGHRMLPVCFEIEVGDKWESRHDAGGEDHRAEVAHANDPDGLLNGADLTRPEVERRVGQAQDLGGHRRILGHRVGDVPAASIFVPREPLQLNDHLRKVRQLGGLAEDSVDRFHGAILSLAASVCLFYVLVLAIPLHMFRAKALNHQRKEIPMLTAATQPHARDLAFTVVGFFPSGEPFSDTVVASQPQEAKIRVIAGLRYMEEGGDLEVSCVIDDATGKVVDETPLESFLSESLALDSLVYQLREAIPGPALTFGHDGLTAAEIDKLNAYLELFELVLSDAPHALDGITVGAEGYADEDLMMRFIDSMGAEHEIIPAEALATLASTSLRLGFTPAAAQIEELARRARSAVSLAVLEGICEE